jgi:hypothetical protein
MDTDRGEHILYSKGVVLLLHQINRSHEICWQRTGLTLLWVAATHLVILQIDPAKRPPCSLKPLVPNSSSSLPHWTLETKIKLLIKPGSLKLGGRRPDANGGTHVPRLDLILEHQTVCNDGDMANPIWNIHQKSMILRGASNFAATPLFCSIPCAS